jgi:hypothetical protein
MTSALNLITWITLVVGLILIVLGMTMFRRKGEAELSQSITEVPAFILGCVVTILSVILKVVILYV